MILLNVNNLPIRRHSRKIHRIVVPVAVAPIIVVSLSGAVYGSLINLNIELPWLLKVHTGNFGFLNLQSFYSPVLGVLTLIVAFSGIPLLLQQRRKSSEL
jgi:hypothetical protein